MAKFGRVGRAVDLLGPTAPADKAEISGAPAPDAVADETERDILFFSLCGATRSREFMTAVSEVKRTVLGLGGTFEPLRADSPRGIYTEAFSMVSFCVPVVVQKGQAGALSRPQLLSVLQKSDPALAAVLVKIEEGAYDGR